MVSEKQSRHFARVPWRAFRHDAANPSPVPAWFFVAAFAASLVLAYLCQREFGAVAIWPANGVLVAALLLLERRKAIATFIVCVATNIVFDLTARNSGLDASLVYPLLNGLESFTVAWLARRFCGAALALHRPARMARFAILAAAPAVCLAALLGLTIVGTEPQLFQSYFASWVSAELLPILVIAPSIVMLSKRKSTTDTPQASPVAAAWLITIGVSFTALVFSGIASLPVATIIPVLLLISLRLRARQAAVMALLITTVATLLFLFMHQAFDSFALAPKPEVQPGILELTLDLPAFYTFLASLILVIFSASTVVAEKSRLQARLQRRAAEARQDAFQLKEAKGLAEQAAEAKRRFLNMISHELRTPLGQVAGYATLLSDDRCLSEISRENVAQVSRANAHALELVDDMLDFARADLSTEPVQFNAGEAVESVLDHLRSIVLAHELTVRFENHLPDGTVVVGDPRRLRQLLRLLLHNATKFTDEGEIGISAEATERGIQLTIFDTGCGFDTSRLPELLQVFEQGDSSQTRCKEGAGIGLALAKRLLDAMGGSWIIDSQIARGTRITLDLPMEPVAQAPSAEVSDEGRSLRILVVDDHPANRHILAQYLGVFGCEVAQAANGVEAVEAARTETFDLILMDLRMPCLDGYETSRQIRALDSSMAQIPILAVSAECREESLPLCRAAGIDDFLSKPVGQQALLDALIAWLNPEAVAAKRDEAKVA